MQCFKIGQGKKKWEREFGIDSCKEIKEEWSEGRWGCPTVKIARRRPQMERNGERPCVPIQFQSEISLHFTSFLLQVVYFYALIVSAGEGQPEREWEREGRREGALTWQPIGRGEGERGGNVLRTSTSGGGGGGGAGGRAAWRPVPRRPRASTFQRAGQ